MDRIRRNSLSNAYPSLWTLTAAQLRDQVASINPTPGGGSVSIIAGTLGVASIHKSIVVSLKKSAADFARHQSLLGLSSKTSALIVSLSEFANADSHAFQGYLNACSLPCTTEDEKVLRRVAREVGLMRATQVPLEAAVEMGRGLELAQAAAGLVDEHVRSEVLTGSALLRASIQSVLLNVDVNLLGISDVPLRNALRSQRNELQRRSILPIEVDTH
jgi:methenyltetrahydrofolate cyclohydrolase